MGDAESVDILCIGSGSAGLAAGVIGAGAGLKVLVAEPNPASTAPTRQVGVSVESWTTLLQRRWGVEQFNSATMDYLEELTSSLGPPAPARDHPHLAFDTVEAFSGIEDDPSGVVPPFCGAELAAWARECLTSPFGMLFSRVRQSTMAEMRTVDGTTIRAGLVAPVPISRRRELTVRQWLAELADDRDVTVRESCSVQRLLFDEGQVAGAVLDTADGVRTVRARHSVVLGTSCSTGDDALPVSLMSTAGDTALCIVGRSASRFARLEFLLDAASHSAISAPGRPA